MTIRTRPALGVILILGVLLSACGTTGAGDAEASESGSVGPLAPTVELAELPAPDFPELDAPADPLNLEIAVDETQAVSSVLSYEGGTLTASGPDGTTYTLEIPEGALYAPTQIRMTPVMSVGGLPFGEGVTYAVQLEPDGLRLSDVAILTIMTSEEIPLEERVFFGYLAQGQDAHLIPSLPDSASMRIPVIHFSGYGASKGFLADTEPVRRRVAADVEARLESIYQVEMSRYWQKAREGTLTEQEEADSRHFLEWYANAFYREVVRPRLDLAGESCAAGYLAINTALGFERQIAIAGLPDIRGDALLAELPRSSSLSCVGACRKNTNCAGTTTSCTACAMPRSSRQDRQQSSACRTARRIPSL